MKYADVIIDVSHEKLDQTFQYAIPEELEMQAKPGAMVVVQFGRGNRIIKGYIVGLSDEPKWEPKKIKPIKEIVKKSILIESQLIELAYWIKEQYGATMNDALKTVIPVKTKIKPKEKKMVSLAVNREEACDYLCRFKRKKHTAKARLLQALLEDGNLDLAVVCSKLNISRNTINNLCTAGIISVEVTVLYRNPKRFENSDDKRITLNENQRVIANDFIMDYKGGIRTTYLIHGITGSGKTEVYMEAIKYVISQGKQVIMLIPEIALTYQTVMRFCHRFGDRVSFLHSKLSSGERYDQYLRARKGEIDVMIGPRSALFTPFPNLGLIVVDEEHEASYKSESPPKYHARDVAVKRGELTNSSVILGSATPSVDSYKKALDGTYQLYRLHKRAGSARLPKVWIVDLREELKEKNRSIFSRKLRELVFDRLEKKQQIMLFINRRGYAGFVSCRSCGHVIKCPHCDVSLTAHKDGMLVCHYCGYEEPFPKVCPQCGSKYIAAFGTGTQKVEEMLKKEFPVARVLRMDMDTTSKKDGHEKILSEFRNQQADILIGTQMIVKGHDFPNVTLVGVLAADLSLFSSDYSAAERTFQLLCQAAGRTGRGKKEGEAVIQTYHPEHYAVQAAAEEKYKKFYNHEMAFRSLMHYPPVWHMVAIMITSKEDEAAYRGSIMLIKYMKQKERQKQMEQIGPVRAAVGKINDIYRWVIYMKCVEYQRLKEQKDELETYIKNNEKFQKCTIQFDFNPIHSY